MPSAQSGEPRKKMKPRGKPFAKGTYDPRRFTQTDEKLSEIRRIARMAQDALPDGMKRMVEIMLDPKTSDKTAMEAFKLVADRGLGQPVHMGVQMQIEAGHFDVGGAQAQAQQQADAAAAPGKVSKNEILALIQQTRDELAQQRLHVPARDEEVLEGELVEAS